MPFPQWQGPDPLQAHGSFLLRRDHRSPAPGRPLQTRTAIAIRKCFQAFRIHLIRILVAHFLQPISRPFTLIQMPVIQQCLFRFGHQDFVRSITNSPVTKKSLLLDMSVVGKNCQVYNKLQETVCRIDLIRMSEGFKASVGFVTNRDLERIRAELGLGVPGVKPWRTFASSSNFSAMGGSKRSSGNLGFTAFWWLSLRIFLSFFWQLWRFWRFWRLSRLWRVWGGSRSRFSRWRGRR